jgi:hydrogenase expression/formation protein HypD
MAKKGVVFTCFGDCLRVPVRMGHFWTLKRRHGLRIVTHQRRPQNGARRAAEGILVLPVGFVTKAPSTAIEVWRNRLKIEFWCRTGLYLRMVACPDG